jgi:pyrimidine operon attenuation protein/uracil phosphoribosyltransferase
VLYTGRTIRGALNVLFDYGRPASVELAALFDRGQRELPFAATYCGATVTVDAGQTLVLKEADGRFSATFESSNR